MSTTGRDTFVIDHFSTRPPFASFLPGIAGEWGIPVWCYYANRGQAVCSFGLSDKDHAVMEFSPAHVAYQSVRRKGFRSFVRRREADGTQRFTEAFGDDSGSMAISPNALSLSWEDGATRLEVTYFVLPGCQVGALARQVTLTNLGGEAEIDLLDGMPALVPAGVGQDALKNMTQLSKAWMQAEDAVPDSAERRWAIYRVRYSMEDSAVIHEIRECHFAVGADEDGRRLPVIVDPDAVFGYDTSLERPLGFLAENFGQRQAVSNLFPCAFFRRCKWLKTGESLVLNELYGGADSRERFLDGLIRPFPLDARWFAEKRREAEEVAAKLTAVIGGRTADPVFDAYARQSYLDNLVRGGEPVRFTDGARQKIFYCYSRKHGDMEREYNYFVMSPEHFSQGNGNFRDVAQNRRCDVRFHPWVGDSAIRLFFSLVQADGYNPLVIDRMTFRLPDAGELLALVAEKDRAAARSLLAGSFTPGQLAMAAETWAFAGTDAAAFTEKALARAESEPNATFQEGYWTDHWTYSLDLIENFLAVWPEKKDSLLFGAADYPWYETRALVLPRASRAEVTAGGLRQVRFLDRARKEGCPRRWMQERHGLGGRAHSTLIEKMVLLCAVKYAARDRAGIGLEMEAGKPGWYDALNGMPGIFGSSVADACELKRLIAWTAQALEERPGELSLYREMAGLLRAMDGRPGWAERMRVLEAYREATADGVDGERLALSHVEAARILRQMEADMAERLAAAVRLGGGVCPAYLTFSPEAAEDPADTGRVTPRFLEGPVRWLKLDASPEEKREMARKVKESGLYDSELRMYKVNESLADLTFEAGRCKAFTPGWLENESIWLHMEYKYLLELLRSGLYAEFEEAIGTALVPFMNPEVYGRSPYENVSFIASSANPTPAFRGRGFVARLSGSTAEFLSMWQEMMFGPAPFTVADGRLTLRFAPMIPARLIPEDGLLEAVFLGQTRVRYHIPGRESLIPGAYTVAACAVDGRRIEGGVLPQPVAEQVRDGQVRGIDVWIQRS